MTNTELVLEISELEKSYGKTKVVKGINLQIKKGEIFAFLGPNGAGKTTTIKIITGLLNKDSGRVKIFGKDVEKVGTEEKMRMGFIPDKPYLYEKLSAREYLDFVTRIYGTGAKQIEEFADKFGIFENLDQTVESFSHGMRQRLVFAATFVHKPEFVVIDEPMVGLDPIASRLVKDFLRNFVEKGGAILLSTHTMSVVEEVADRISIIKKGSLMETGTLDEIRERALNKGNLEALFLEITK